MSSQKMYEVASILESKVQNGKRFYLLNWRNWDSKYNSWQSLENMTPALRKAAKMFDGTPIHFPVEEETEKSYPVKAITQRIVEPNGEAKYMVHWDGYEERDNSLLTKDQFDSLEMVEKFEEKRHTENMVNRAEALLRESLSNNNQ